MKPRKVPRKSNRPERGKCKLEINANMPSNLPHSRCSRRQISWFENLSILQQPNISKAHSWQRCTPFCSWLGFQQWSKSLPKSCWPESKVPAVGTGPSLQTEGCYEFWVYIHQFLVPWSEDTGNAQFPCVLFPRNRQQVRCATPRLHSLHLCRKSKTCTLGLCRGYYKLHSWPIVFF